MTPRIIVEEKTKKVKMEVLPTIKVYGKLTLHVFYPSQFVAEELIEINQLNINTVSGNVFVVDVHDFHLNIKESEDDYDFGTLVLYISLSLEDVSAKIGLIAANYLLNELTLEFDEITVPLLFGDEIIMEVNDFSLSWDLVE